ncbi:MAG: hypothetical protein FIB04_04055 [Gammaproteobacteria bacterium]|nr:hypothetical protein [Gammaproteobacteria bacterium]
MHARIDQLLSLRDGEPTDAAVRAHVESCGDCTDALVRLQGVRERLRKLPPADAQPHAWQAIEAKLAGHESAARRQLRVTRLAAAASVAALAVLAAVALQDRWRVSPVHEPVVATAPAKTTDPAAVEQLRERSVALEQLLAAMPARPAVERADVSMPIDTLEAQVQWLDHQLSLAGAERGGPGRSDAERLWRERVELMSSLVQLRYVEAQRVLL